MRRTFILLLIAVPAAVAIAYGTLHLTGAFRAADGGGPRIVVAEERHDCGRIEEGDEVRHEFAFTNTGDRPLEILRVDSACDCFIVDAWTRRVEPGATGTIPVRIQTLGFRGDFEKSVKAITNDPARPEVRLTLHWYVKQIIECIPPSASFDVIREKEQPASMTVTIVNHLPEPLEIVKAVCRNPDFAVEMTTTKPGWEFALAVTVRPPFKNGFQYGVIDVTTNHPRKPTFTIQADYYLQEPVRIVPTLLLLPPAPLSKPRTLQVHVIVIEEGHVALSDLSLNLEGIAPRLVVLKEGKNYRIDCDLPAGFQLPVGILVALRFRTSHPSYPEVTIPITSSPVKEGGR